MIDATSCDKLLLSFLADNLNMLIAFTVLIGFNWVVEKFSAVTTLKSIPLERAARVLGYLKVTLFYALLAYFVITFLLKVFYCLQSELTSYNIINILFS